jgi:hypothetical protein
MNPNRVARLLQAAFFFSLLCFGLFAYLHPGVDLRGYYGAALLVRRGGNPYDYTQLAPVLKEISGFTGNNPYFYPPWYCLFFIPMTFLPFEIARVLWIILNLGLFYVSLEWLWEVIDWPVERWFRWAAFTFASILFGYACLVSENAGFVLLFGLALTLRGIRRNQTILTGLGLILALTKPQATLFVVLFLAVWLIRRKPAALGWGAAWAAGLLGAATVVIPRWWDFDYSSFGQGLTYYLNGPGTIAGIRVAATIYDWLRYTFGIGGSAQITIAAIFWLLGIALVIFVWKRYPNPAYLAAATLILTLLLTPYALQYDYVPLTLAFLLTLKHLPDLKPLPRAASTLLLVLSVLVLFLAKMQYQTTWILLFVASSFAIALLAKKPLTPALREAPFRAPKFEKG